MRTKRWKMKRPVWAWTVVLALVVGVLAGCSKGTEASAEGSASTTVPPAGTPDPGGLDRTSRLALGTLELEGTEDAVTPAQAAELLPLWQMIAAGSLQGGAETDAVVKQIEGMMTESQRAAIDGMALTGTDVQAWMQEQGIEMPTPQAGQGGPGALQNLSEEERTQMREEFQNMSAEERATRMAEMGVQRPEGAPEGAPGGGEQGFDPGSRASRVGPGGTSVMLDPLVDLLTARAAEK